MPDLGQHPGIFDIEIFLSLAAQHKRHKAFDTEHSERKGTLASDKLVAK